MADLIHRAHIRLRLHFPLTPSVNAKDDEEVEDKNTSCSNRRNHVETGNNLLVEYRYLLVLFVLDRTDPVVELEVSVHEFVGVCYHEQTFLGGDGVLLADFWLDVACDYGFSRPVSRATCVNIDIDLKLLAHIEVDHQLIIYRLLLYFPQHSIVYKWVDIDLVIAGIILPLKLVPSLPIVQLICVKRLHELIRPQTRIRRLVVLQAAVALAEAGAKCEHLIVPGAVGEHVLVFSGVRVVGFVATYY